MLPRVHHPLALLDDGRLYFADHQRLDFGPLPAHQRHHRPIHAQELLGGPGRRHRQRLLDAGHLRRLPGQTAATPPQPHQVFV